MLRITGLSLEQTTSQFIASMRPQRDAADNDKRPIMADLRDSGFNEAAA